MIDSATGRNHDKGSAKQRDNGTDVGLTGTNVPVHRVDDNSRLRALGLKRHVEIEEERMSSEAEIVDVLSTESLPVHLIRRVANGHAGM